MYYVYILKCADNTFYTGITTNINRRLIEHNNSSLGAKYTKGRRPVRLIYSAEFNDRSSATKKEAQVKKMSRNEKIKFLEKL